MELRSFFTSSSCPNAPFLGNTAAHRHRQLLQAAGTASSVGTRTERPCSSAAGGGVGEVLLDVAPLLGCTVDTPPTTLTLQLWLALDSVTADVSACV